MQQIRRVAGFSRRVLRCGGKALGSLAGRGVECIVCGWQGEVLGSDKWHLHTICPNCHSQVRHRLLAAALSRIESLSYYRIVKGKDVLHFAPDPGLKAFLQKHSATYLSADLCAHPHEAIDLELDISSMPALQSGRFDLVIACDVLEHVPDDLAAMREIHRILRPGGYAILTVPQKDNLDVTFEDPTITTPQERERAFGQSDHLRIYGNDFPRLFAGAGFDVTIVNEGSFPRSLVKRQVLVPPILSSHPLATNHRKVFFGRKN